LEQFIFSGSIQFFNQKIYQVMKKLLLMMSLLFITITTFAQDNFETNYNVVIDHIYGENIKSNQKTLWTLNENYTIDVLTFDGKSTIIRFTKAITRTYLDRIEILIFNGTKHTMSFTAYTDGLAYVTMYNDKATLYCCNKKEFRDIFRL
jgi:hypothetical protein